MKRVAKTLLLILFIVVLLAGGGTIAWMLHVQKNTFFTDGSAIKRPVDDAPIRDVLWQPPLELGEVVNSDQDDYEPRITADDSHLYFVRGKAGENADILVSDRTLDGWSEPRLLEVINSEFDDLGPTPTSDGSAIYFYSNRPGGSGGYDIWVTRKTADGWQTPVNPGSSVNTRYNDYGPVVSPDGKILYFSSNRPNPRNQSLSQIEENKENWSATLREDLLSRDYDLYYTILTETGFNNAEPLVTLNTQFNEGSPEITPSGDFLYFSSDRDGGMGGFDLYRSRRLKGDHLTPENIEAPVNTIANELDPAIDMGGFRLTFSSDRILDRAEQELGVDGEWPPPDYNLFYAMSREVFLDQDRDATDINWAQLWETLWPSLLWMLLALLAILLLLAILRRLEYKRLSLIAKCLLTSVLVHMLIMLLLTVWAVSTSLSDFIKDEGGMRVALITSQSASDIEMQIRSNMTEVEINPAENPTEVQQATETTLLNPTIVMANMAVAERLLETNDESSIEFQTTEANPSEELTVPQTQTNEVETAQLPDVEIPAEEMKDNSQEQQHQITQAEKFTKPSSEKLASDISPNQTTSVAEADILPATEHNLDDPNQNTSLASTVRETEARPVQTDVAVVERSYDAVESTEPVADIATPDSVTSRVAANEETESVITSTAIKAERVHADKTTINPPSEDGIQVTLSPESSTDEVQDISLASAAPSLREAEVDEAVTTTSMNFEPEIQFNTVAAVALPEANTEKPMLLADAEATSTVTTKEISSERQRTVKAPLEVSMNAEVSDIEPADINYQPTDKKLTKVETQSLNDIAISANTTEIPSINSLEPDFPELEAPMLTNFEETSKEANTYAEVLTESNSTAVKYIAATSERTAGEMTPDLENTPAEVALSPGRRSESEESIDPETLVTTDTSESELDPTNTFEPAMLANPELKEFRVADLPSIDRILDDIGLPSEKMVEESPFPQRAPDERMEIVKKMGGSEETENAVSMALAWLARHQSADGRWDADNFDENCGECGDESNSQIDNALTGLSLLAFLAADHTPDKPGPYQGNVQRAIEWLKKRQTRTGSMLGPRSNAETMYSHGIATIALSEAFAMTGDPQLHQAVEDAIEFILKAPNKEYGGWRYAPGQIGDTSVTGWQVMALASAMKGDIDVPDEALDHVRNWMDVVRHPREAGRYGYQPGRQYTHAMTAEGMFIRQLLGVSRDDSDMRASAAFLMRNLPDWDENPNTYYWYYGTLAMFHYQGAGWEQWNQAIKRELTENQHTSGEAAGSWDPVDQWSRIGGRVYQTAIAALCLEVYYRYLPLYAPSDIMEAVGTISGHVTNAETNEPLEGAVVLLDLPDRPPVTTRTDIDGWYILSAPEMSEFFALSAASRGFSPATATASADELRGKTLKRDFALIPLSENVVAVEAFPEVHHLGNDKFTGRINSQFQKKAEGITYTGIFELSRDQLPPNYNRVEIRLFCKGVQSNNQISINGVRLRTRLNNSPRNGDYGEFIAPFDIRMLNEGENTISISSVDETGDRDDFEFVNVQIHFSGSR